MPLSQSRIQALRAMANQTESPREAEIAADILRRHGLPLRPAAAGEHWASGHPGGYGTGRPTQKPSGPFPHASVPGTHYDGPITAESLTDFFDTFFGQRAKARGPQPTPKMTASHKAFAEAMERMDRDWGRRRRGDPPPRVEIGEDTLTSLRRLLADVRSDL
jgi:hypothetical protein